MDRTEIDPSLLEQFQVVTNADFAMAQFLLEASNGDFDLALNTFFGEARDIIHRTIAKATRRCSLTHHLHGSPFSPSLQNNSKLQQLQHHNNKHPMRLRISKRTDQQPSEEPFKVPWSSRPPP